MICHNCGKMLKAKFHRCECQSLVKEYDAVMKELSKPTPTGPDAQFAMPAIPIYKFIGSFLQDPSWIMSDRDRMTVRRVPGGWQYKRKGVEQLSSRDTVFLYSHYPYVSELFDRRELEQFSSWSLSRSS